jgi:hypothetical protein
MYVNTKETITKTYTSINPVGVLPIGTMNEFGNSKYSWNGLIDDVRIYNRALSAEEVSKLYRGEWVSDTGLVGHWEMDEGYGGQVRDKSGNGNHGTIYGATWGSSAPEWVDDTSGGALEFDGVGDYVNIINNENLNSIENGGSWSFWVKPDMDLRQNQWIGFLDTSPGNIGAIQSMVDSSNYLRACFGGVNGARWLIDSDWTGGQYHIVGTWDKKVNPTVKLFVNGTQMSQDTVSLPGVRVDLLDIGRVNNSSKFNGQIDDVRIYNRALSEAEIQKIYEYGRTNKFYLSE